MQTTKAIEQLLVEWISQEVLLGTPPTSELNPPPRARKKPALEERYPTFGTIAGYTPLSHIHRCHPSSWSQAQTLNHW